MMRIGTQPCMSGPAAEGRLVNVFSSPSQKKARPQSDASRVTGVSARGLPKHRMLSQATDSGIELSQGRRGGCSRSNPEILSPEPTCTMHLMPRLAWFSPMPPVATGVAACSADLVGALGGDHRDRRLRRRGGRARLAPGTHSATTSCGGTSSSPYDLTVYQLGNSSHHDYQWPYLFSYPGLTVLHDAHLHHARAAALLRTFRAADYRTEFAWNHPDASPDLAELAVAGFDTHLYYAWPMTRLVVDASRSWRCTARRSPSGCATSPGRLRQRDPAGTRHAAVDAERRARRRTRARARYGIAPDAVVFGCFGGLSPDKRLPQVLAAFAATRRTSPPRTCCSPAPCRSITISGRTSSGTASPTR